MPAQAPDRIIRPIGLHDPATVHRPGFAHYIEPTGSGEVTWVGDEIGWGEPAIVRFLDSTNLPQPGCLGSCPLSASTSVSLN